MILEQNKRTFLDSNDISKALSLSSRQLAMVGHETSKKGQAEKRQFHL